MDQGTINQICHALKKRMSSLDVAGLRPSRRVEGLYAQDQDARGFPNMLIYLDQELDAKAGEIADILYDIDRYLGGYNAGKRIRYFFSFGGDGGSLVRHAHTDIRRMTREQWQGWTALIRDANVAASELIIPSLFNGQKFGTRPCPGKHDLLIFFCRSREVFMSGEAAKQYSFLKGNALWFFFNAGKSEWELGNFEPCLFEHQESQG